MKSWKSRKFIVFAASAVGYFINDVAGYPVDEVAIDQLIMLIVGWLVAQGIADAGEKNAETKRKGPPPPPPPPSSSR